MKGTASSVMLFVHLCICAFVHLCICACSSIGIMQAFDSSLQSFSAACMHLLQHRVIFCSMQSFDAVCNHLFRHSMYIQQTRQMPQAHEQRGQAYHASLSPPERSTVVSRLFFPVVGPHRRGGTLRIVRIDPATSPPQHRKPGTTQPRITRDCIFLLQVRP